MGRKQQAICHKANLIVKGRRYKYGKIIRWEHHDTMEDTIQIAMLNTDTVVRLDRETHRRLACIQQHTKTKFTKLKKGRFCIAQRVISGILPSA